MKSIIKTDRLKLRKIELADAVLIFKLFNSDNWIRYIGDRSIRSVNDAENYLRKILTQENFHYWVIQNEALESMGITSFIKRDYLQHFDIGFALLPEFYGGGFAYESASGLLTYVQQELNHHTLLAITVPENKKSIRLLEKLGFSFREQLDRDSHKMNIYQIQSEGDSQKMITMI